MTLIQFAGIAAVVFSTLVITSKNPVLSVLYLICVFLCMALGLVLYGTTYLGLAYIIIYVGAIAILFLFVIMMLNIKISDLVYTGRELAQNLPLGALLILLFVPLARSIHSTEMSSSTESSDLSHTSPSGLVPELSSFATTGDPTAALNNFMQIESIGMGLYTNLIVWLIAVSFILMLAMVGPILLCMQPQSEDDSVKTVSDE